MSVSKAVVSPGIRDRVRAMDWAGLSEHLETNGWAILASALDENECRELVGLYDEETRFRKRIIMAHHGYGRGEYKYFQYPLPQVVEEMRTELYPQLAPVANRWHESMRLETRFPAGHGEFLERCHEAGQTRPTPLILRYGPSDYNALHQDLYGEHVFPLQVAFLLSEPGEDFAGGEFVLTEQRPRMQSRATVVPLRRGDGLVFAVHQRPVQGTRGLYRVKMRHGVSVVRTGARHTLGVIFHDAQ